MTHRIISLAAALLGIALPLSSQVLPWAGLQDGQRHIAQFSTGLENGYTFTLGYGHRLPLERFPLVLQADATLPAGRHLPDDLRLRAGGQIRWVEFHHFHLSSRLQGVARTYNNVYAGMTNFGADFSTSIGYHRPHWHLAADFGWDKAIVTRIQLKDNYLQHYPEAESGWYGPTTGGAIRYGLQAGATLGVRHDLTLRLGKSVFDDFRSSPILPFYAQLGYNFRW